jgi:hypothetical protein
MSYNRIKDKYKKDNKELDEKIMTEFESAIESKNTMLTLLLSVKYFGKSINKNIMISTYHMPCKYMYKYFVISHIIATRLHLDEINEKWNAKYDNSDYIILAGDFNISVDSPEYKFLVDEEYSEEELSGCANFINLAKKMYIEAGCQFQSKMKFRSVHKSLLGKEPEYTNVCLQKDKIFVECLDYILINENVGIKSCTVGLTVPTPKETSYPNGLCPSDHLPLSASLFI